MPALHRFKPDMIIVACGFDAGAYDPQARMMLHCECFRDMTRMVHGGCGDAVRRAPSADHEGGYHRPSVPFLGLAVIEQLSG